MQTRLDTYAHGTSPLHRWDVRYKLVALLTLMFAFAAVRTLWLLPPMLLVTAALYAYSRLPLAFLLSRLRYPGFFLLAVLLLLPLSSGQTMLLSLGPLALRYEGTQAALLILCRFTSIITLGIVLFGTAPMLHTIRAMHSLGLPSLLTDMLLFFWRYLHDIASNLARMQTAMRLRGFRISRINRRTLSTLATLIGTLLIRSYTQSERVYQAMRLRGYGAAPPPRAYYQATPRDKLALAGVVLLALGFVLADWMLP
jgi:cobalt/nickel transport system permease protein